MEKNDGILKNVEREDIELLINNPEKFWENVVAIDSDAFYLHEGYWKSDSGCFVLKSITIPNTVKTLYPRTFESCKDLSEITFPENMTRLNYGVCYQCYKLSKVNLPKYLKVIDAEAFLYCTSLKSIELPYTVTRIEERAFCCCINLTDINLPENLEYIGERAFAGCSSLKKLHLPNSVKRIGYKAFSGCESLLELTLPDNIQIDYPECFKDLKSLTKVNIPTQLTPLSLKNISQIFEYCPQAFIQLDTKYFTKQYEESLRKCKDAIKKGLKERIKDNMTEKEMTFIKDIISMVEKKCKLENKKLFNNMKEGEINKKKIYDSIERI